MRPLPRDRAFTLVELLVVVSIVALLLAILLPTLSMAREAGRRAVCLANLAGVGVGLQVYLNDHDDVLPFAFPLDDSSNFTSEEQTAADVNPEGVLAVFEPHLDTLEVFICPADDQIPQLR